MTRFSRRTSSHPRASRKWMLPLASFVLIAGMGLPYTLLDAEPHRLDDSHRAATDGSFVRLSGGYTHYEVAGPEGGQPVVLVHGTTVPSFIWDPNVHELSSAGLRAIRYDLYGRGLSDRPDARYDLDLYVDQLAEMLAHVAPGQPVDLVGFSLGGMIITEFTRRYPEQVRKLVLIGPGGVADPPLIARIITAPGVGEYVMRVAGSRQLLPSRRMLLHPERHPALDSMYLPTIAFRDSRRAVLRTLRTVPYSGYEDAYRALGDLGKPTLLVWGRQDRVVPFSNSVPLRSLVRPTKLVAVEDAGHMVSYERPEVVNPELLAFLTR